MFPAPNKSINEYNRKLNYTGHLYGLELTSPIIVQVECRTIPITGLWDYRRKPYYRFPNAVRSLSITVLPFVEIRTIPFRLSVLCLFFEIRTAPLGLSALSLSLSKSVLYLFRYPYKAIPRSPYYPFYDYRRITLLRLCRRPYWGLFRYPFYALAVGTHAVPLFWLLW